MQQTLSLNKLLKKYRNLARKKLFKRPPPATDAPETNDEDINSLDTTAKLELGKNVQIAAKKSVKNIKKIRAKKQKMILVEEPEEIVVLPKMTKRRRA